MQAVLLAAGKSSRFYPYNTYHKSYVSVLGKPIIEHTLLAIIKSGIKDVIIVINKNSPIKSTIGDGENLGIKIKYVEQNENLGMGDAILRAKKHIISDFFVLNAYHVDFYEFKSLLEKKYRKNKNVTLLAKKTDILDKYGVLIVNGDNVVEIIEKPEKEKIPSNLRIIGIYALTYNFLETLSNTPLSHYHFEKALSTHAKQKGVKFVVTDKETVSLKYSWDILQIKNYLVKNLRRKISNKSFISKDARIIGNVCIEEGAQIMEGAYIKGPCYIGRNAYVGTYSFLRNAVDLEKDGIIGSYMEVKNSLIMEGSTTHSGFIGDSIVGTGSKIGAGFCTANVRLDRKDVKSEMGSESLNTEIHSLGVIVGKNTRIGINVATMPGIIIGNNALVGPSTTVFKNIKDYTKVYTKFEEIIEKSDVFDVNNETKKQKMVLFDIDYTLFNTDIFKKTKLGKYELYQEVDDILNEIKDIADIGIFSEGEINFQKTKLIKTNIYKHFDEEHIYIGKAKDEILGEVLNKYKNYLLFLIDDKLQVLYKAKKKLPSIFTIWVERGIYAENQKPIAGFIPDARIKDLYDIIQIIGND